MFTVLMPATTWAENYPQPCRLVALQWEPISMPEWHSSHWGDYTGPEAEPGRRRWHHPS